MKTKIFTLLVAFFLFNLLLFIQANAQPNGPCLAKFGTYGNGCAITFIDSSTGTSLNTTYSWNFGDGQTSNQQHPTHTYTASGTYSVCLTIVSPSSGGNACTDTYCKSITVNCGNSTPCTANWVYQADTINPCTIIFTDSSTGTSVSTTYSWNFGDGQTSNQPNPNHTYTASGTYSVCLTIINQTLNGSCTDTYCQMVTVNCGHSTPCTASWSSQTGSSACTVNFTDLSAGASAWSWDFGDGNFSTSQNPSHTYTASGTYNVCLIITVLVAGTTPCYDTLCKNVTVQCGGNQTGIGSSEKVNISLSVNNPVLSSADIRYSLPVSGNVQLALFDIVGNKIAVLENGNKNTGMHSYFLHTTGFSKGIYFIHLGFEGATVTKKIIISE